jgi:hypothetical protein
MKAFICYGLVILIGLTGMASVLVWCIKGESDPLQWDIAILSMAVILIAIKCMKGGRDE